MKLFISWSGENSRRLADLFRHFIPTIFQRAAVFTTTEDIEKGSNWISNIESQLSESDAALLCVTPEAMNSPWLLFEAGALSKSIGPNRIIPVLAGLSPVDLTGPLIQFQTTKLEKRDIKKLLSYFNSEFNLGLNGSSFESLFEALWPNFEREMHRIVSRLEDTSTEEGPQVKSNRELLEETVQEIRNLKARLNAVEKKA